MPVEIPITFLGDDGMPTDDYVRGSPCIRVAVFAVYERGPGADIPASPTWALLDTGADQFYVDRSLIEKHQAPKIREVAGKADGTSLHDIYVHITGDRFTFRQEVVACDMVGLEQPFRVILGRQFFKYARFEFSLREGDPSRLLFYGNG
ncbi:hypothetical protein RHIZ404_90007 [Rhizobium sp. EC-SD404]|nr:hypothetical protein RHIZ404_90007 [Rhizobium sp. EC-SD404]